MPTKSYVTDLREYAGPVDDISPYHYYQHVYWTLRGTWRRLLYAWTRREPCDVSARIEPTRAIAGVRTPFEIVLTVGATPLPAGGRAAVYFPLGFGGDLLRNALPTFQGPDGQQGYGTRVSARTEPEAKAVRVLVHSTGTVFTCVEVVLEEGELREGERLRVLIGGEESKPCVPSERAKGYPFRIAVDFAGDDTFRPIRPEPVVEVVGNRAGYLRCFAPATPAPGETFPVRVIAADLFNHNPSYHHTGELAFRALGGEAETPRPVPMPEDAHGSLLVDGFALRDGAARRIEVVDRRNALMGRTNPICPEAAPEGLSLYYGEIHSHTDISDGGGTVDDNFRWAREAEGLDFAALADHFEDGQSYNYTLEEKWAITKDAVARWNEPGRFVTLLGYEIGTLHSHRNVYFPDGEGRMIVEGPEGEGVTMENVFDKLDGTEYVLIPHAPKFHGIDWRMPPYRPDRQRLVEICSYWGISEEGGPLSVRAALDLGYKLGFTGGTDNHVAEPGNPNQGGITGVYAKELTRRSVFDALLARRCFATSGPRMIVTFRLNGAFMGEEIEVAPDAPRRLVARALACEPIRTFEVIRNGEVVYATRPDAEDATLAWEDAAPLAGLCPARELVETRFAYYYVRVTTVNGDLGWSSPVWVHPAE